MSNSKIHHDSNSIHNKDSSDASISNYNRANDPTTTPTTNNAGLTNNDLNVRLLSAMKRGTSLLHECVGSREKTSAVLERAGELASRAGLSVDSYVVNPNHPTNTSRVGIPEDYMDDNPTSINDSNNGRQQQPQRGQQQQTRLGGSVHPPFLHNCHNTTIPPLMKVVDNVNQTGAYSNTDHYVQRTGDKRADRIAELKRHLLRRHRSMRPEDRGEERWDKPKLPGERRRRIVRQKDLDIAPPEPPATGWTTFLFQMTHKMRHDRPKSEHDQAKIIQEISKLYRLALSDDDREYYVQFARDANKEYQRQLIEFRATGSYRTSTHFRRFRNVNVWVRSDLPNQLEREIFKYKQEDKDKEGAENDDDNEEGNDREEAEEDDEEEGNDGEEVNNEDIECNDKYEGENDRVPGEEEKEQQGEETPSK